MRPKNAGKSPWPACGEGRSGKVGSTGRMTTLTHIESPCQQKPFPQKKLTKAFAWATFMASKKCFFASCTTRSNPADADRWVRASFENCGPLPVTAEKPKTLRASNSTHLGNFSLLRSQTRYLWIVQTQRPRLNPIKTNPPSPASDFRSPCLPR